MDSIYLTEARVYVAGVLLPTIRATVTCTFNRPPTAEIVLPAYSEFLYLGERDRVPVHIFVRETMVEAPEFILIFEGFVSDTGYINSSLQRSIIIRAISHFDILNDVKVKFMTELEDMFEAILDGTKNMYEIVQVNGLVFPLYLFRYGITRGEKTDPIQFPSDFLENIYGFMQLAGANAPLGIKHSSALAEYFGKQGRMLKLLDRFERLPYFDEPGNDGYAWEIGEAVFEGPGGKSATMFPFLYGVQQEAALGFITRGANNAAKTQSLMELLMYLIEEMEYEYLFISNPAYHSNQTTNVGDGVQAAAEAAEAAAKVGESDDESGSAKDPNFSSILDDTNSETKPAKLVSSCVKPLFTDALPPKCNIMYRTMVDSISMNIVHKGVPTRIQILSTYSQIEHLVKGIHPSMLSMYGLVDYYPSEKYDNFEIDDNIQYDEKNKRYIAKNKRVISSELLEEEEFTGPWIKQVHTPRWFHHITPYIQQNTQKIKVTTKVAGVETEREVELAKVFKERFFRRQLLNMKYFNRQLQVNGVFDPYVTPGFPGVVFDSGDSSFAFAGHVVSVIHSISPSNVSTQVAMNFVRPLHEAGEKEIPNPLISIQAVTHNATRLSEIYQRLLGTNAVTFKDMETLATNTSSETNQNNNLNAAYKDKRRNICTFDQYLNFMGLTATYGNGPEGPQTPVMLDGTYVSERKKMPVYDNTFTFDKIIPEKEQILTGTKVGKAAAKAAAQVAGPSTGSSIVDKIKAVAEAIAKSSQEDGKKKKKTTIRTYTEVDVRTLLRSVAEREFARMIYK